MTRDEIIRMAQEAGIVVTGEAVWMLCKLVAAAEREACAKVCDEYSQDRWAAYKGQLPYKPMPPARKRFLQGQCVGADDCAAAIRARSKP